jgi:GGDEF domain-containing protein
MSGRLGTAEEFVACLDVLCREWPRLSLAVVLVDIDNHGWLAARHGPRRAQECLAAAGDILRECMPSPLSTAYRLDGPRFGVILPCTDEPTARNLADRVCRAIGAQVASFDGRVVRMTAVASICVRGPDEPATAASMHAAAEDALCGVGR